MEGRVWRRLRSILQPGNAMLVIAVLIPAVLFALAAWENHRSTVATAQARVDRTARILEEHALKVFETERLVLVTIDERLRSIDWSSEDQRRALSAFLRRWQVELSQVGTITITDAAGHLRASSRMFPVDTTLDFSDRDWFQALKRSPVNLPFVSRSYTGRQSKMGVFNVADRVPAGADGAFNGAVAISVDRAYFESFYKAIETTYDHSVILVRDDGEILVADPPLPVSKLQATSRLLTETRRAPVGSYEYRSVLDGIDRFFAFRKVGALPVYVRFGISRKAALAPWRDTLLIYGFVAAITSLCLLAAGLLVMRQTRRWRETAAALDAEAKQRERMETQVRQLQKMEAIGQLTGGIAHDFNNMLAVIIGALNLVQRRLSRGDTDVGKMIEMAMEGAGRAATLTQRLLAFSRQQPLKPESLAVNDLVAGMSELLRRTIGETVQLETVLAGGLWRTKADASELENALINLAVNARDAMPKGGKLTIETCNAHLDEAYAGEHDIKAGQYVMIAMTDTGVGMSPDVIARAFDPFYTTKPVGKGTGLGLSQTYGFVKQSAGHVKIYSEPGHGSTFKIYLPRHVSAQAASAPSKGVIAPVAAGRPEEIILVVEDEDRVRTINVDALRDTGFTVIHASCGQEALELLPDHPDITLLFTDVVMPGMSGRELADAVTLQRPQIKVLFATGYTRNAIVHNGALDPDVELISKPFSAEQLAAKVRAVLDAA